MDFIDIIGVLPLKVNIKNLKSMPDKLLQEKTLL